MYILSVPLACCSYVWSACEQVLNLESQLKALHKAHEGSKLNLTQAIEACNFATKKRRAAERQLAKLQVKASCRANVSTKDLNPCPVASKPDLAGARL